MNPPTPSSGRPAPVPDDERHARLREQLGAYTLDQLIEGERAAIDAHLRGCPSCREELNALAPLSTLLTRVDPDRLDEPDDPAAPAPDHFPAILHRIRAEQTEHTEHDDPAGQARQAGPGWSAFNAGTEHLGAGPDTPTTETTAMGTGTGTVGTTATGTESTSGGEVVAFRARRARPRLRSQLLVAAAGLVIALAGFSVGVALAPQAPNTAMETVAVQTLTPGLDARAGLIGHTWGVEMKLTATGFTRGQTYRAAVLDDTGRPLDAGAFVGTGDTEMRCSLTSSVLRDQASGFVVTDTAGAPVLISQFT